MNKQTLRAVLLSICAAGAVGSLYLQAQDSQNVPVREHRASKVIGITVVSVTGEALGEVKDIVFDNEGTATHVVVSYGGALGVGGKLAAVPWSVAVSMLNDNRLVIDRLRLEGAPAFQDDQWPDLAKRGWSKEADNYWQGPNAALRSARGPDVDADSPARSRRRRERD